MLSIAEKRSDPFQCVASNSIVLKLVDESCVWYFVKCFGEVQKYNVHLLDLPLAMDEDNL